MQTNEFNQLHKVYNGNQTIINAGFKMESTYFLPVLSRMKNEGLINDAGATVVQAIFSFKHTEENPFPTRETIARYLGMSVDYVKKALKAIKLAGILGIKKVGRKSTYDFKPFFTLLEKFIVEYKHKGNSEVKISDLLNVKVVKESEAKDFSWSEDYKSEDNVIVPVEGAEPVQDASEEAEEVTNIKLPEAISNVVEAYSVDAQGIESINKAYSAFSSRLVDEIFVEKIIASTGKKDFANYFTKCITNAYTNNEQPKQQPTQTTKPLDYRPAYVQNGKKVGTVPHWFKTPEQKLEEEKLLLLEAEKGIPFEKAIMKINSSVELDEFVDGKELSEEQKELFLNRRTEVIEFEIAKELVAKRIDGLHSDKQEGAK